jgi:hypothetical protein
MDALDDGSCAISGQAWMPTKGVVDLVDTTSEMNKIRRIRRWQY